MKAVNGEYCRDEKGRLFKVWGQNVRVEVEVKSRSSYWRDASKADAARAISAVAKAGK